MLASPLCQSTHMLRDQTLLHCTHYSIQSNNLCRKYSGHDPAIGLDRQWQLDPADSRVPGPKERQFYTTPPPNLTMFRLLWSALMQYPLRLAACGDLIMVRSTPCPIRKTFRISCISLADGNKVCANHPPYLTLSRFGLPLPFPMRDRDVFRVCHALL